jgi:diguanylate cyclase (GGDEF)-like protein
MSDINTTNDPLTGLLHRKAFEDKLSTLINRSRLDLTPLSMAFFDIDNFLLVNNQFGHIGGDSVLVGIARILVENLNSNTLVFRYGGDEFALLFPETEREQAFLKMEKIRFIVEQQTTYSNGEYSLKCQLTISGGVAAFPIDASDENELLRKADGALYRAKGSGRNKINLAYEERMSPKTSHYTLTQLERLSELSREQGIGEAVLLREALDDLLIKYKHSFLFIDRHS